MSKKEVYEKIKQTNNTAYKRLLSLYKYHLESEDIDKNRKKTNQTQENK